MPELITNLKLNLELWTLYTKVRRPPASSSSSMPAKEGVARGQQGGRNGLHSVLAILRLFRTAPSDGKWGSRGSCTENVNRSNDTPVAGRH